MKFWDTEIIETEFNFDKNKEFYKTQQPKKGRPSKAKA
jgi:hypothetical protein